ncbi:MAG: hypothetical protein FJ145_02720 [Deltaproteobacteria bacterium]|nr:hypothetical protein [Deltaproteobacteria bacterium]
MGPTILVSAFLVSAFLISCAAPCAAQVATVRVGTNSPASAESVLFTIARDAGVLRQNQLDVEVIFIGGGTLSMQALVGRSLDPSAWCGSAREAV